MSCQELERWLEDGALEALPDAVRTHALACSHCAARLRAADELEQALSRTVAVAPAAFVHQVMARVAEARQGRVLVPLTEVLPLLQTLPWWVRLALDPAAILATLVVSLWLWQGDTLLALAGSGAARLVAWLAQMAPAAQSAPAASASIWLQPVMVTAIALAAAPLLLMSSRLLYDWSAHLFAPRLRVRIH